MSTLLVIVIYLIGFASGFVAAAYASVCTDRDAVRCGMIKLCGSIYRIEKIDI